MSTDTAKEQRGFESEVQQLLDLVINSLYSNREIFLRELVSNAADAADKLRFAALSDDSLYEGDSELGIEIEFSKDPATITIRDNGIGMSRDEVVTNLGTIAKSGTREFFGALSGDQKQDSQLIGQFGVGFYAAFIVADRVEVTTRKAGLESGAGVRWESEGKGDYTVETIDVARRGTEIVLHLKEESADLADAYRLRELCKRYSDHISLPVKMSKIGEDEQDLEVVNQATALWLRAKSDISDEEYHEFYKHVSHDFADPMSWVHSKVEGTVEYTSLFYIPGKAPFDLFERDVTHGIKLYVQRVFIMDDAEALMPRYLRFVRGIIDTNDLPLNVSREIVQKNKVLDSIRAASVKKVLGLIETLAKGEEYDKFWSNFGRVLKEGVIEDMQNQERIAKLLRFSSTHEDKMEADVSLEDYVARAGEDSDTIYYIVTDSFQTARNSPHLEYYREQGIEVLLMHDPVDEWLVTHLMNFEGKALKSVVHADPMEAASEDGGKKADDDKQAADEPNDNIVISRVKQALNERVEDVRASNRLTTSPARLVSSGEQMSANLERILKSAGQEVPDTKRILELNLDHPMVRMVEGMDDDSRIAQFAQLLFEQSILAEGGKLDDPAGFVRRMNEVVVNMAGSGA